MQRPFVNPHISAELARAVFENNAEAIYRAMARRLMKGDVGAFKILAETGVWEAEGTGRIGPWGFGFG